MKVYILGGEGNGLVIGAIIKRNIENVKLAFLNDVDEIGTTIGKFEKITVEGITDDIRDRLVEDDTYVISGYGGFTNPAATLSRIHSLRIPSNRWFTLIDSTAVVPKEFCEIGMGCLIAPLVQLSANAEIGNHTSIFGNAFVGHDTVVGEFCHIASNAVVGARIKIGKGVHIGLNSTIRENVTIGNYSVVGAGAVVVKDVPPNTFVVGNPARILKTR